jgi:hypothetical protein
VSFCIELNTMQGDVQCGEVSFARNMRGDVMRGKGKLGNVTRGVTIAPIMLNVIMLKDIMLTVMAPLKRLCDFECLQVSPEPTRMKRIALPRFEGRLISLSKILD